MFNSDYNRNMKRQLGLINRRFVDSFDEGAPSIRFSSASKKGGANNEDAEKEEAIAKWHEADTKEKSAQSELSKAENELKQQGYGKPSNRKLYYRGIGGVSSTPAEIQERQRQRDADNQAIIDQEVANEQAIDDEEAEFDRKELEETRKMNQEDLDEFIKEQGQLVDEAKLAIKEKNDALKKQEEEEEAEEERILKQQDEDMKALTAVGNLKNFHPCEQNFAQHEADEHEDQVDEEEEANDEIEEHAHEDDQSGGGKSNFQRQLYLINKRYADFYNDDKPLVRFGNASKKI